MPVDVKMITKMKMSDSKAFLTKKKALQIFHKHLIQEIPKEFEICDGVPFGIQYYNMSKEPCWSALIPSGQTWTGASRIICLSKKTGKVIYDGPINDE